jgi:hypothetical protein
MMQGIAGIRNGSCGLSGGNGKKEEGMENIVTKSCGVWIKKQKGVIELLSEAYGDEQELQNLVAELDAREYRNLPTLSRGSFQDS